MNTTMLDEYYGLPIDEYEEILEYIDHGLSFE
jgi:hypothetical protein